MKAACQITLVSGKLCRQVARRRCGTCGRGCCALHSVGAAEGWQCTDCRSGAKRGLVALDGGKP